MKRLLLAVLLVSLLGTGPVAAANASTNATPANATASNATAPTGGPVPIDGVATISGWSYHDGAMTVTLEASQYHVVTLSGSATRSGRVAHHAYSQVVLQRGDTATVQVPADRVDGRASVSVTTSACITSGSCPSVFSREDSSGSLLPGRPTGGDWIVTLLAAGIAVLLGAGLAGFGYKRYVGGRRRVF